MGNWQLEVAKMALYMAFPVGVFHYFNHPNNFEEWMTKTKQEIYPHDSKIKHKEMKDIIRKIQEKQDLKALKALEDSAE